MRGLQFPYQLLGGYEMIDTLLQRAAPTRRWRRP
ncbi:MAG: hypothetical protein ACI906_005380, partial [Candidatus Latescibacterota bacterium]